ncbi:MAG: fumarylacetoacetase [Boseongicola sp. SB0676_bin_33]|uniref:fumarylacetoacetase n=1 Tax=Boseongicola sp. SB0664_bin_43 TaxID=2604844 RepID=A0A6B0XZE6_9RHOB|nr:fumarylacetoacetase [Boseongicola sp. SB0664_bin_43]MYF90454.1 fumarylacetoacetase [Boseongicola sp. SB0676_bin_33]
MALRKSWVESANDPEGWFPLNNLPYGVFDDGNGPRAGVALGDMVLDLAALEEQGILPAAGFRHCALNNFMAEGPGSWERVRDALTRMLAEGAQERDRIAGFLHAQSAVAMLLPFAVSEFTDFYAGRHHAANVGTMFRGPESALPPNWLHMPIGYNGRASSVVVSGTDVRRPWGQLKGPGDEAPRFAPSNRFDIELEMGAVVGQASDGPLGVTEADANIFGHVLLNDWSARDIQAWEYQPLGPFQAKATATTISPWVVTKAALEPFRCNPPPREKELLPHLRDAGPMLHDIELEVTLEPEGGTEETIVRTNSRELYYSSAQQLAHHATSGCPMRVGDLVGTGTISGPERGSRGSLLELSWGGKEPLELAQGGTRSFIEDGDRLTLRGFARGDGYRIGFGDCTGKVLPALEDPFS